MEKKNWFERNKTFIVIVLVAIAAIALLMLAGNCNKEPSVVTTDIAYSQFIDDLESGKIESVRFHKKEAKNLEGKYKEPIEGKEHRFFVLLPAIPDYEFIENVRNYGVTIDETHEDKKSFFGGLLPFLPMILIFGFVLFIIIRMMNAQNQMMRGPKNGKRSMVPGLHRRRGVVATERFSDVAGIDEVVEELQEIVDFLKTPAKFTALGAKPPKGVLLFGPPGVGKTLLARAVAGEAEVSFFRISGSEFVEMFVGVGASRVRDLFDDARKEAPAIIFIDEIDAIGRHRGAGIGGGHDEREQTLNQILNEMDGFDANTGIVVIAATNRPDILDPALLRPGRFDRHVVLNLPRKQGRLAILNIHTKGKPLASDVDLEEIARLAFGFSGADLENLCNEAARLAVRKKRLDVSMQEFREARIRILVGPNRKEQPGEKEKEVAAYHEAGHALVAHLLPEVPQLEHVSIVSRGMTGGVTEAVPEEENYILRKRELLGHIKFALGGRVAEEIVFHEPSTGAEDDLVKATQIAESMIVKWGMSEKLAPRTFGKSRGSIFLGKDIQTIQDYGEHTQEEIDGEIAHIMRSAHEEVTALIIENKDKLEKLAKALLEREELSREEIKNLFA